MEYTSTLRKCLAFILSLITTLTFSQQFQLNQDSHSPLAIGNTSYLTSNSDEAMYTSESFVAANNRVLESSVKDFSPAYLPNSSALKRQLDAPMYVLASADRVCGGDSIYLHATCYTGTVVWYMTSTGTNSIGTGASLGIIPINNGAYYAACESGSEKSTRVATQQVMVLVKPSMPIDVKVNKTNVCQGSAIILSGSCSDGNLIWFMNDTDTDSIGVGDTLHLNAMDTRSYYAACTNGICVSYRVPTDTVVIMALPAEPTQVTVDRTEVCSGANINLSSACGSGQPAWYNTSVGGAILDGGGSQYPTENSTYYSVCINNMCESGRIATVEIRVTPQPTLPTLVMANKTSVCKGESITLSANCEIGTASWYTYPTGPGTFQGSGNTLSVTPDENTTYFAACENGLCISERVRTEEVVVSNHMVAPTNVAINYTEVCSGSPVSLSADYSNGTLKWYTTASGGTSIGAGTNLVHNPTDNTIYYAACESGACTSDRVASVQLKIKPKPAKPVILGNATICAGESVNLTSSSGESGATCYWSDGSTGFSVVVSPTSNTRYRVLVKTSTCISDSSDAYSITVNPLPQQPTITANNPSICKGGSALLTGQAASPTDKFYWSTPVMNAASNSNNGETRVVTEPGTYKGWSESVHGCRSAEKSIVILESGDCNGQVFIKIMPEKPVICPNTSIILTANGCNGNITWMDGTSTYTGSSLKVSPSVTTSYMAQCSTGGMAAKDVVVAQTNVTVTGNIATGVERVKAILSLESSKKIGEPDYTPAPNVSFEAGGSITLKPGFVAEKFSTFSAVIRGCG
jgi:hypothetical protein